MFVFFPSKRNFGFTLIELLIVVAIIAILAAIAVPNFLEAQTRAKISRVKSDFRTIALGMEAYMVDHNLYPRDSDDTIGQMRNGIPENGLVLLTTPVAYITTLATESFYRASADESTRYFEMGSGSDNNGSQKVHCWEISSVGPDFDDDTSRNDSFPFDCILRPYDGTNGTKSNGDLYRFGGDYMAGDWEVYNIHHGQWSVSAVFPE